jgi:hypothetical protein
MGRCISQWWAERLFTLNYKELIMTYSSLFLIDNYYPLSIPLPRCVFKLEVTAVPVGQMILRLTDQLRCSLYSVVDAVLGIEIRMKMLKNGQIILDFPRQKIYYTNTYKQPQIVLVDGTGVRITGCFAGLCGQSSRNQVSPSHRAGC